MPSSSQKLDTRRGRWPDAADEARVEVIAIAQRIRELVLRAEEAQLRGNRDEAMRLMALINDKSNAIEDIMRRVKTGEWRAD